MRSFKSLRLATVNLKYFLKQNPQTGHHHLISHPKHKCIGESNGAIRPENKNDQVGLSSVEILKSEE